ncbi:MAG: 4Fe-4S dicluster domain-containing protein [Thermodesulfobacteriota bacterium]
MNATPERAAAAIRPSGELAARARAQCGADLSACYGCRKCSNGCPLGWAMDLHPYQVVRLAQLGQVERLKAANTVWVCASCQTCLTRCPNQVDLPRFMDWLKEELALANAPVAEARSLLFHRLFLGGVLKRGRVFEGELLARFMLKSGGALGPEALKNAKLGLAMLKRGRIKLLPPRRRARDLLAQLKARAREARP